MLKKMFYFLVFLLVLGQFSVIARLGEANIYFFDIFAAFFSIFGILYFLGIKRKFKLFKYFNLFLVFSVFALFSLIFNFYNFLGSELLVASFYFFRFNFYLLSALVVYNMLLVGMLSREEVIWAMLWGGFFVTLAGFFQLIILPDFTVLDPSLGWDPHKNRLASTFFDPNFTGGFLFICIALALQLTYNGKLKDKKLIMFLILPIVALLLTFSRSSWLMFSVIIFVFGILKSPRLLFFAVLLAFGAYFAVPRVQTRIAGITDPADSAQFRLISWQNTLDVVKDNWLFGVGFNGFRYVQQDYGFINLGSTGGNAGAGSDSSFLLVLATTGIFGFVVFLIAFMYPIWAEMALKSSTRCKNSVKNLFLKRNSFSVVIVAVLLGLLFHSQFVNSFFYPQILFFVLLLLLF